MASPFYLVAAAAVRAG